MIDHMLSSILPVAHCALLVFSIWGIGLLTAKLINSTAALPHLFLGFMSLLLIGGCLAALHVGTLFSLVVIMFIGTIRAGLELKHRLSDWFKFVKKTGQSLMNDQRLLLCLLFCVCVFTWFEASLIYRPFSMSMTIMEAIWFLFKDYCS